MQATLAGSLPTSVTTSSTETGPASVAAGSEASTPDAVTDPQTSVSGGLDPAGAMSSDVTTDVPTDNTSDLSTVQDDGALTANSESKDCPTSHPQDDDSGTYTWNYNGNGFFHPKVFSITMRFGWCTNERTVTRYRYTSLSFAETFWGSVDGFNYQGEVPGSALGGWYNYNGNGNNTGYYHFVQVEVKTCPPRVVCSSTQTINEKDWVHYNNTAIVQAN
jgi:hypothetical protein